MKCKKCNQEKDINDFYISRKKPMSNCKKCVIEKNNRKYKTTKKEQLEDDLRFRIEIIKQLFKID